MNVNQLNILKSVVESGNFSKAAIKLDLTCAAVSKQIKALEKSLNVPLFDRQAKKIQLTNVGKVVYEKALEVLDRVHDIELFAQKLDEEPAGTLKIICHTGVSETLLLTHLTAFLENYPKISLSISITSRFRPEHAEKYDILFGVVGEVMNEYFEAWRYKKIYQGCLKFAASKSYLQKYGKPESINDLKHHRYLRLKTRLHDEVLAQCEEQDVKPKKILSFDDTAAMIYTAAQGMGLVAVPDIMFNPKLSRHNFSLTQIPNLFPTLEQQKYTLYLLYKRTEFPQQKVTVFKEFMLKRL